MALPRVRVTLNADGTGEVRIDDVPLPGVVSVQITGAVRERPQVAVTLLPDEITCDLPETGVQLLRSGPTAADFAEQISPARLEELALDRLAMSDDTQGEAFAAAVRAQAAEFDAGRG